MGAESDLCFGGICQYFRASLQYTKSFPDKKEYLLEVDCRLFIEILHVDTKE